MSLIFVLLAWIERGRSETQVPGDQSEGLSEPAATVYTARIDERNGVFKCICAFCA